MTGPTDHGDASALASMFEAGTDTVRLWRDEELAAVLRHQLAAPLLVDLGTLRGVTAGQVADLAARADPPVRTFGDLLRHPTPPLELLELTKRFAKRARGSKGSALPEEVAAVLYFGSVHRARGCCGKRISNLREDQLRDGLEWVRAQPWIDPATRALFDVPVT